MPVAAEGFFLDPGYRGTLQQQIQEMVLEGIRAGRLRAGDRMPSSRALARHLGVSRITVTLAYTELVANDVLEARGRSGYFVSAAAPVLPPARSAPPDLDTGIDWASRIGTRHSDHGMLPRIRDWHAYPYPFIYGQADPTLFDHQNWRKCALMALGRRDFDVLSHDFYERDDPMLVDYILRAILPRRGITARPDQILLTLGAQNALWIAAHVLLRPGQSAAIEEPGFHGFRTILNQHGVTIRPVPVDDEGLPPEAIPDGVAAVFVTPSHHFPTNATMPAVRRAALLELAQSRDFLIVEDDYEFETSFLRPAQPALKSFDRTGRVIHVGSFSKSLFPGLRLGYLVGAAPFIREARALRVAMLRHPPGHIQRTLAHFLALGHYDALINRMNTAWRRRRQAMSEAIAQHGLSVAGSGEFGGSSFWMRAPDSVDTEELAARLRQDGVLIEPGHVHFTRQPAPRNLYRLAYSSIPQARIAEGIVRIARAIG